MEKVIRYISFILLLCVLSTCASIQKAQYFYTERNEYASVIDSLENVEGLSLPKLSNWDKSQYFTNDSIIVTTWMWMTNKVDTIYVFTVIQDPISGYVVKYRKEWREKK